MSIPKFFITIRPTIKQPINQAVPPASLEIRNAVFQELDKDLSASNYTQELVIAGSMFY